MAENNRLRAGAAGRISEHPLELAHAREHAARMEEERDILREVVDRMIEDREAFKSGETIARFRFFQSPERSWH